MPNATPALVEFLVSLGDHENSTTFLKGRDAYIDAFPGLSPEERRRLKSRDLEWVQQQLHGERLCVWVR